MTAIIELDAHRPHRSGFAFCKACLWPWVAVAPADVEHLECPACGMMGGRFAIDEPVERSIASHIMRHFDQNFGKKATDVGVEEAKIMVRHEIEHALYQATQSMQKNLLAGDPA